MTRQPILLNHEGTDTPSIMGYTNRREFEEAMRKLDAHNPEDQDKMLAAGILAAVEMMPNSQRGLLGIIFQMIYGEDKVEKLSHVVETIVNSIPTDQQVSTLLGIVASEAMGNRFKG